MLEEVLELVVELANGLNVIVVAVVDELNDNLETTNGGLDRWSETSELVGEGVLVEVEGDRLRGDRCVSVGGVGVRDAFNQRRLLDTLSKSLGTFLARAFDNGTGVAVKLFLVKNGKTCAKGMVLGTAGDVGDNGFEVLLSVEVRTALLTTFVTSLEEGVGNATLETYVLGH